MYLFILESIGTQELILIAAVALIVFGPRKLPQIAKTIGKTMAEFRNATSEFKSTWEKEVQFEEDDKPVERPSLLTNSNSIHNENKVIEHDDSNLPDDEPLKPEIKEISSEEINRIFHNKDKKEDSYIEETPTENYVPAKRDWL